MSPAGGSKPCVTGCDCGKHVKPKGANSPNWVGDKITHKAMHTRVIQVRGRAATHNCLFCAERELAVPAYDWAHIHETCGLHVADFIPLCRKCHRRFDLDAGARTPEKISAGRARRKVAAA